MKWSCTLCGSREWPSTTTTCPLCRDYSDEKPSGLEDEIDEDGQTDQPLAPAKNSKPNTNDTILQQQHRNRG